MNKGLKGMKSASSKILMGMMTRNSEFSSLTADDALCNESGSFKWETFLNKFFSYDSCILELS